MQKSSSENSVNSTVGDSSRALRAASASTSVSGKSVASTLQETPLGSWIDRNERKPHASGVVWAWHEGAVQEVNAAWVAGPYSMARYWMPIPWPLPPLGMKPHPKQEPARES